MTHTQIAHNIDITAGIIDSITIPIANSEPIIRGLDIRVMRDKNTMPISVGLVDSAIHMD